MKSIDTRPGGEFDDDAIVEFRLEGVSCAKSEAHGVVCGLGDGSRLEVLSGNTLVGSLDMNDSADCGGAGKRCFLRTYWHTAGHATCQSALLRKSFFDLSALSEDALSHPAALTVKLDGLEVAMVEPSGRVARLFAHAAAERARIAEEAREPERRRIAAEQATARRKADEDARRVRAEVEATASARRSVEAKCQDWYGLATGSADACTDRAREIADATIATADSFAIKGYRLDSPPTSIANDAAYRFYGESDSTAGHDTGEHFLTYVHHSNRFYMELTVHACDAPAFVSNLELNVKDATDKDFDDYVDALTRRLGTPPKSSTRSGSMWGAEWKLKSRTRKNASLMLEYRSTSYGAGNYFGSGRSPFPSQLYLRLWSDSPQRACIDRKDRAEQAKAARSRQNTSGPASSQLVNAPKRFECRVTCAQHPGEVGYPVGAVEVAAGSAGEAEELVKREATDKHLCPLGTWATRANQCTLR